MDTICLIVWLVLFLVLLLAEIITLGLTTIWFAIGALAAILAVVLGADLVVQILVFIAVSILVLLVLRPFAVKYINSNPTKTNVEEMAGKIGKVLEDINNSEGKGMVVISGMEWTARAEDDNDIINAGDMVKVLRVEGVKVIVIRADK
ncbi:MAG: NfeD family protein [Eubacterium sp.]